MAEKRKQYLSISWLFAFPILIVGLYLFSEPSFSGHVVSIISLLILMIIVSLFPIQLPMTNFSLILGVQLVVLQQYGIFLEAILTQIAVAVSIYFLRTPFKDHSRYAANSLMFLMMSISAGGVFYLLGGEVGNLGLNEYPKILPVIGYTITFILVNHLLLYLIKTKIFMVAPTPLKEFVMEGIITLLVLPIGLILYTMHSVQGPLAILYVGLPYIVIVFITNLYHMTQKINDLLQEASRIGQELTESFDVDEILDTFMDRLTKMLEVDHAYILSVHEHENKLEIARIISEEQSLMEKRFLEKGRGISGKALRTGESVRYDQRNQWRKLARGFLPLTVQSILCVPMKRNQEIVGLVTFSSNKKFAYKKHHQTIVQLLANYLAVAIDKAHNYIETKQRSERCPLTNLFNYRYFEERLDERFAQNVEPFSVVLIDLDHFKQVNDTFGHQSGNDVLIELANRLQQFASDEDLVARYGGEEFIILLKNKGQEEAYLFAERLRHYISKNGFVIKKSLDDNHTDRIYLTASIGVATAPEQGEDPLSLIRNADRAMYIGAKQQGRNKVASYVG